METYTLQYASDLHLDVESPPFHMLIEPVAQELALCGDIGKPYTQLYKDFLTWCSKHWAKVYLLAGNHEYFTEDPTKLYSDVDSQIRRVCNEAGPNIEFLQNELVFLEKYKIVIVGSTLWSIPDIRIWDKLNVNFIGSPGNKGEYYTIYKKDEFSGEPRLFHPSDITALCLQNIAFIRKTLNTTWGSIPEGWRVIVLTHHLPSFGLIASEYKNEPMVSTYAVALDDLIKEPVIAWICGHSHNAKFERFTSGTLACLNPLGYKNQVATSGYSRKAVIQVYRENIAIPRVL
jgi:hypothetical protein